MHERQRPRLESEIWVTFTITRAFYRKGICFSSLICRLFQVAITRLNRFNGSLPQGDVRAIKTGEQQTIFVQKAPGVFFPELPPYNPTLSVRIPGAT
ncbi:hypothetical protein AU511_07800 [Lonsdalea iberica]|uniref:Uncharacterized protein n=1 Tax=Lonsdalea iberica TaxID=1082703 RepID=A0A1X3RW00_9GAMM|nr:hypothetical protein AU511_07800 [Lonsdalea iberica]